ncbi:MAG: M23 family metallopeptidase [Epsilonproteobacteria bacterium]|nr:M23 family metallopeptidase [Campylobacterota bacterium]
MRFVLVVWFLALQLFALHVTGIDSQVANGKTASITFAKQKGVVYSYVEMGKKKFPIVQVPHDKGSYFSLIPVSYYEKAKPQELFVHYKKDGQKQKTMLYLDVVKGSYAFEEIKVDPGKVNPKSKQVRDRIAKEYNEAMKIYNTVTPKLYISKPFILPLQSKITSDFGKARVYNGSHKGYHSGTDFRAKVGTPIVATNDGKVVFVKDRFYSGGTVIIDHGEGIYSCYFHLSQFKVTKGQMVKRGEVIALSGKSGRVTGPHLHFSARINGIQVDPLQFVTLINTRILKE